MSMWSIGPIRGQFQPESFIETQKTSIEEIPIFGTIPVVLFKGWGLREVQLSFVVDGMCDPVEGETTWGRDPREFQNRPSREPTASDPEQVWSEIQRMQRPPNGGVSLRVPVYIPGWRRSNGNRPKVALITDSSINRTHIRGRNSHGVRAIISVTLRETSRFIGSSLQDAQQFQLGQEAAIEEARKGAESARNRALGINT